MAAMAAATPLTCRCPVSGTSSSKSAVAAVLGLRGRRPAWLRGSLAAAAAGRGLRQRGGARRRVGCRAEMSPGSTGGFDPADCCFRLRPFHTAVFGAPTSRTSANADLPPHKTADVVYVDGPLAGQGLQFDWAYKSRRSYCLACLPAVNAMSPELTEAVEKFLAANKVVLFMKGNKMFPQCGFSNTCVQILNTLSVPYETVNILEDERLRQGMKEYSKWPTFPQLYIDGEFFGGCDIAIEAYTNGELKEIVEKAMLS